ncbi:MAG: epoxyqueuosine reductase QueH, partial [Lachnospiraceae bacterium]|nr:epoxyqueuosine reductase QueH [Lachnospiraceae bacterium]
MNPRNYQKELDEIIKGLDRTPTLLLHACCAPCSSYVLEYLSQYFEITLFYYNPNITEEAEYCRRVEEAKRLIGEMKLKHPVRFLEGKYDPETYFEAVKGHES